MTAPLSLLKIKQVTILCLAALLTSSVLLTGCSSKETSATDSTSSSTATTTELTNYDLEFTDRDKDASYDESSATKISLNSTTASIEGDSSSVSVSNGIITITQEGVYVFSGAWEGQIRVNCNQEDNAKVQIALNGVTLTSTDGPAIYVEQAKKCFITLPEGTSNTVTDSSTYTLDADSDEPYAAIFSKDNLTLQGSGSLTVNANYRHGIVSKDDLVVTGGTYTINAVEDALRGRDCVKVCGGTFALTSGEDAIKSNNDSEDTVGYVYIADGSFSINAGDDGIHAETALIVDNGTITVQKSNEGLEGQFIYLNGGTIDVTASDDGINAASGSSSDSPTAGVADAGMNHKFDMPEGVTEEDFNPAGNPGQVSAPGANTGQTSSPNANPGQASTQTTGSSQASTQTAEPKQTSTQTSNTAPANNQSTSNSSNCLIKITGGNLTVNASGDGIDSNGTIEITGGNTIINGPVNNGDGALDYESTATISGGSVIAIGSSGMAEGFTGGDQAFAMANINGNAGDTITVKDSSGKTLMTTTAVKSFANVVVSCAEFKTGETYTIETGGTSVSITPSTEATTNSFNTQGFGGSGMQGMQPR